MRSISLIALALAIPLSALAGEERLPATGSLRGQLVDIDGRPIRGGRIWLAPWSQAETPMAETISAEDGTFELDNVPPAHHVCLWAEGDGLARERIKRVNVYPGVDLDLGAFVLAPGTRLRGRVTDDEGDPMPGCRIEVQSLYFYQGHTMIWSGPTKQIKTDEQGAFEVSGLPPGQVGVTVRSDSHAHANLARFIAAGLEDLELGDIRLGEDVPIRGVVVDSGAKPVQGAKVWIEIDEERSAMTDETGTFKIRGFRDRPRARIRVRKNGYVFHQERLQDVPRQELSIRRAAPITGRAVDAATGEPVAIEQMVLCEYYTDSDGKSLIRGCRSMDFQQPSPGRFLVHRDAPGTYRLTVVADGYHDGIHMLEGLQGMEPVEDLEIKLTPESGQPAPPTPDSEVIGRVTRDGRPVEVAWVSLLQKPPRERDPVNCDVERGRVVPGRFFVLEETLLGREGTFRIPIPQSGDSFYLAVEEPRRPPAIVGLLALSTAEDTSLEIECASGVSIAGGVEGFPPELAQHVWVVAFGRRGWRAETRMAPDGSFRLADLPADEYGLKVGHDGYRDIEIPERGADGQYPDGAFEQRAEPWKRATKVRLSVGEITTRVVVPYMSGQSVDAVNDRLRAYDR